MRNVFLLFGVLILSSVAARASCTGSTPNQTSTPDQASVTTCWNNAVAACPTAQTITVSAGTATWSSAWTGNATTCNITLTGATTVTFSGTAGASGYSATWGDNSATCSSVGTCITGTVDGVFQPTASNSALVRINGFTWINNDTGTSHGIIGLTGTHAQVNFRFDHNHLLMSPLALTMFAYNGYGYADHDEWDDTGSGGGGPIAIGGDLASAGYLNWQDATNLGSNQSWYVEASIVNFTGPTDGTIDSYYGARHIFRFNTVTATTNALTGGIGWNHGTDSGGYRSTVSMENYGNYFANNTGTAAGVSNSRGGTWLFWGNTLAGTNSWPSLDLQYFRCLGQNHSGGWGLACNTWGSTPNAVLDLAWVPTSASITNAGATVTTLNAPDWTASHSYTCSTGSPCAIGPTSNNAGGYNYIATANCTSSGTRPSFSQTFPPLSGTSDNTCTWYNVGGVLTASPNPGVSYGFLPATPDTTGTTSSYTVAFDGLGGTKGAYPFRDQPGRASNQVLTPNYEWLNGGSQAPGTIFFTDAATTGIIQQNRDYYDYQTTGCTGTQTTGVCSGTLASAATTCTNGVGFWATDQGSWNTSGNGFGNGVLYTCSSNTWVSYYTPYSYPYPGTGSSTVNTPTFSPSAGTYCSAQTVTLSDSTGGATICYTTNGNTPTAGTAGTCDSGSGITTYTVPFSVSATATVKAIGTLASYSNSSVGSSLYTINACTGGSSITGASALTGSSKVQ